MTADNGTPGATDISKAVKLTRLEVKTFRTYSHAEVNFEGDLIFFTGLNGSGKTSLLEAISLMSTLRSFRSATDKDMIQWQQWYYTVDIDISGEDVPQTMHLGYGKNPGSTTSHPVRRMTVDKERIDRVSEFVGRFHTVIFSPNDTEIIDQGPAGRRRFTDMLLSSLYPAYLESLQQYRRVSKMRSELLKQMRGKPLDMNYFRSLHKQLARYGSEIQSKRATFFQQFQKPFERYVKMISDEKDNWSLIYRPNIPEANDIEKYTDVLEASMHNDLRQGTNTRGIHRDRLQISRPEAPSKDLDQVASQGQKRTVALALKMAQYDYTRTLLNQKPVLLIDDVLNELDINRRKRFIEFLNEIGQALITTTDLTGLEDFINTRGAHLKVEHFEISSENSLASIDRAT